MRVNLYRLELNLFPTGATILKKLKTGLTDKLMRLYKIMGAIYKTKPHFILWNIGTGTFYMDIKCNSAVLKLMKTFGIFSLNISTSVDQLFLSHKPRGLLVCYPTPTCEKRGYIIHTINLYSLWVY